MAKEFEKREIVLPIAGKGGEGGERRSTTKETFSFSQIYAVTSPQGTTNHKGALLYIVGHSEYIETAQTYSFRDWVEEISSIDAPSGKPKYNHAFAMLGPRMMVNYELIHNDNLDRKNNQLCLPSIKKPDITLPLERELFAELTHEVAKADNLFFGFLQALVKDMSSSGKARRIDRLAAKESTDTTIGCLGVAILLLLLNTGLLIAILCIVV